MEKVILDATNKKIGRLASEAAKLLIGKNRVDFARNIVPSIQVEIINASKASVATGKLATNLKSRWSEYPSGIKTPTVGQTIQKKGKKELFRQAVYGMLPKNKLQAKMIKNLKISE